MILLISNTNDPTADVVVRELRKRGTRFIRLNTDEYPQWLRGSFSMSGPCVKRVLAWDNREQEIELSSVKSVWYRRPVRPKMPGSVPEDLRKFAEDEAYDFLRGLWYSLSCFWVSHPDSIRRAEHKIYQLAVATRIGFRVPLTLVSNDPSQIRDFSKKCTNGTIAKPVYMGFIENPPRYIYTTLIRSEDLEDTDALRIAPAIFQERVLKVSDIRVTVIGDQVFATELQTDLPESVPDWRAANIKSIRYAPHHLPRKIQDQCRELVRELGLQFGAIDLAIDKNSMYSFFEINPNGQWAWLEPETGFPLTKSLVDLLERPIH